MRSSASLGRKSGGRSPTPPTRPYTPANSHVGRSATILARLGAIISIDTQLVQDHGQVPTIAKVLQKLIAEIARSTPFKELHVIFEASQRADSLIEEAMQGFGLEENGKSIPVECYLMPKSADEPSLEVADFIMHAVGRQARHNITQRGVFLPDFAAVCHSVDSRPLALSR